MAGPDDELQTLFKYRSLAGAYGRSAVTDILLHDRLFWQSPKQFNDPYDCQPAFIFGRNDFDRSNYHKAAIGAMMSDSPLGDRRAALERLEAEDPEATLGRLIAAYDQALERCRITCFSSIGHSFLMWSHYADSHRGVCLVFREVMEPSPFIAVPVRYSRDRPLIDLTQVGDDEFIDLAILGKAADWSYEREMRILEHDSPPGRYAFPSEALTGIIFGARMPDSDRDFVDAVLAKRTVGLDRFQAELHPTRYALEIKRILA